MSLLRRCANAKPRNQSSRWPVGVFANHYNLDFLPVTLYSNWIVHLLLLLSAAAAKHGCGPRCTCATDYRGSGSSISGPEPVAVRYPTFKSVKMKGKLNIYPFWKFAIQLNWRAAPKLHNYWHWHSGVHDRQPPLPSPAAAIILSKNISLTLKA